jgi:hypothetical protein
VTAPPSTARPPRSAPASVAVSVDLSADSSVAAAFDATGATIIAGGGVSAINDQGGATSQSESVRGTADLSTLPLTGNLAIGLLGVSLAVNFSQVTFVASESLSGSELTIGVTMDVTGLDAGGLDGFGFVIGTTPIAPSESGIGGTFRNASAASGSLTPDTVSSLGLVPSGHASR